MDKSEKIIIGVVVLLLALIIYLAWNEVDECYSRGGEMVGTGRYSTIYILQNNIMIPVTSEIMECSVNE